MTPEHTHCPLCGGELEIGSGRWVTCPACDEDMLIHVTRRESGEVLL